MWLYLFHLKKVGIEKEDTIRSYLTKCEIDHRYDGKNNEMNFNVE